MFTFSQRPYFDDYDENKKYYDILARPSFPLQNREFNQIQSILQNQIQRLGDHLFKEGAKVLDGQISFDTSISYVKLSSCIRNPSNLIGMTLTGNRTGSKATVVTVLPQQGDDPVTLYVRFVSSDTTNNATNWEQGESIAEYSDIIIEDSTDAIGLASIAEITRGVYYIHGYFALVDAQTLVLDKYSNTPSCRVGLQVEQSIVTPEEDQTLLDNAMGSYNYAAPGAHRLKIELILSKVALSSKVDNNNFIELGQLQSGKIIKQVTKTEYSDLEKTLARRTYDESGDYTVRPFKIAVREHRSNDRGDWKQGIKYLVGDVVRNFGTSYVAKTSGISEVGQGPQHLTGTSNDGTISWEVTDSPEFNNGVFSAEGRVTGVNVIDGGNGYVSQPQVIFESNSGSGAVATAVISEGKVTDVIIDDPGSGYLSGDISVKFSGGLQTVEDGVCVTGEEAPVNATAIAELDSGDENKIAIGLESGKAYVQGFEIEKLGTEWIPVDKARTYTTRTNVFLTPNVGNYFYVTNIVGVPPVSVDNGANISKVGKLDIYNQMFDMSSSTIKGKKVGSCRVRGMEWDSGSQHSSTAGVYRLYVYDVQLNTGVNLSTDVKGFYGSDGTNVFACNISPTLTAITGAVTSNGQGTITGTGTNFTVQLKANDYLQVDGQFYHITKINGQNSLTTDTNKSCSNSIAYLCTTQINETQTASMIYPLPDSFIKTLTVADIDYTTMQYLTGVANSANKITFSAPANAVFSNPEEADNLILIDLHTHKICKFTSDTSSSASKGITLTVNEAVSGHNFALLATLRKSGTSVGLRSKTRTLRSETISVSNSTNKVVKLAKADAYRLVSVKTMSDDGATIDITDHYDLETGQTESYYGQSSIVLKSGYSIPTSGLQVEYYYFEHGTGDYYCADSYDGISYDEIPSFNGVRLSDVLDFRPTITDNDIDNIMMVKRGTEIETGYQYYLARADKICLDYMGNFVDVPGVPSSDPQLSTTPAMSMSLYNIYLKPYTLDVSKDNVVVSQIDNRRYTMRDIGALEKRISNLEEMTALSLLEQQTESMQIQDENGLTRFKQGFVVDNFQSNSLITNIDSNAGCSIDTENGICRPSFSQRSVGLTEYISSGTALSVRNANNYKVWNGNIYTLALDPVTPHVAIVEQPLATRIQNINPFAVAAFVGSLTVNPSSDDWFETQYLPDIITQVEGNYLSTKNSLEGTKWNSWQLSWTGTKTSKTTSQFTHYTGRTRHNRWDHYLDTTVTSWQEGQTRTGVKTTVTSTTDYEQVGDRLVSTSSIPYMRSRWLLVKAYNLKPYTRYYPYFDGVGVDYWCVPAAKIEYEAGGTDFDAESSASNDSNNIARKIVTTKYSYWPEETDRTCLNLGDVIRGKGTNGVNITAVVVGKSYCPTENNRNKLSKALYVVNIKQQDGTALAGRSSSTDTTAVTFATNSTITASGSISGGTGTVTYAEPNKNHTEDGLITNASGELFFMFWIPDGDKIDYSSSKNTTPVFQFRCGDRIFSLSESSTSNDYNAEATYSAVGTLYKREKLINAVRNAVVHTEYVSENRTVNKSSTSTDTHADYRDPLAQTFLTGVSGGCFLTKVDIYFASKPNNDNPLPVTLQIRTVENGMPTSKVLPFAEVTLRPDQVNISRNTIQYVDASGSSVTAAKYDTPTTFEFSAPVYVEDTGEYAVVLLSDSNDYNVWIAHLGEVCPGTENYVSKQPYMGVLLKSQNASTWSAEQTEDLMMTIYRANFKVADQTSNQPVIGNIQFATQNTQLDELDENPFQTISGSSVVRVFKQYHGLQPGMKATISYRDINEVDQTNLLTGRITAAKGIPTVTGSGTRFAHELEANDTLYDSEGNQIGQVKSINSDTDLTLISAATKNFSLVQYSTQQDVTSFNGIAAEKFVGSFTVLSSDLESYVINLGSGSDYQATATGRTGGTCFIGNYVANYDVIQPNINVQTFSDTSLGLSAMTVTGTSAGNTTQQDIPSFGVTENENNYLTEPMAIWDDTNRIKNKRPSLIYNITFDSDNSCLSPVIDGDRVSGILINNLVNDPVESNYNNDTLDTQTIVSATDGSVIGCYGGVDSVNVTSTGTNYKSATVTFSDPTGITPANGGITATGDVELNNGHIVSVNITNPGIGYIKAPTATITGVAIEGTTLTAGTVSVVMKYNQLATSADATIKKFEDIVVGRYLMFTQGNKETKTKVINKYTSGSLVAIYCDQSFTPIAKVASPIIKQRNHYTDEISPTDGSVYSKYITKPITLNKTCNLVKIIFAGCVPKMSDLTVYYKAYVGDKYQTTPWTLIEPTSAITKVDSSSEQYSDIEYVDENVDSYDTIAVKICMTSSDSSQVPSVKDLRVIGCI